MGLLISKVWKRLFASTKEFKIIIVGLAGAGKTTMLYQLCVNFSCFMSLISPSHLGKTVQTQPTIGSNVEEVKNKNVKLQVIRHFLRIRRNIA